MIQKQFSHLKNSLVSLDGISYKHKNAMHLCIDHVSLQIDWGKIYTIIGPNGAGKTTLLHLILGFLNPQQGVIQKDQNLIIGYMPQKLSVDQSLPLTVESFLKLSYQSKFFTSNGQDVQSKIMEILDMLHIRHCLRQSIHTLSGGEWQRVLLARALLPNPNLLILDEPVQCLDHNGQHEFYKLIAEYIQKKTFTIVQVSHDLHLVWDKSDEIICLNKHICCKGHPKDIHLSEEFQTLFCGFKPYHHHHNHQHE